ncbi:MAG: hypothetical protein VXV96_05720 [Bdellovibrionota bacterium]|nr:hypothetical protein [Bdellovibrionota bacterium]
MKPFLQRIFLFQRRVFSLFLCLIILALLPALMGATTLWKSILCAVVSTVAIGPLLYCGSHFYNSYLGAKQFHYKYGNLAPHLSLLVKNPIGQKSFQLAYRLFPNLSGELSLHIAEESAKIFWLKRLITQEESSLCGFLNRYQCFEKTLESIQQHSPLGQTRSILATATGALIIFKEKEKLTKKNQKEEVLKDSVFRLVRMTLLAQRSLHKEGRLKNLLPGFPAAEIADLGPKRIEEAKRHQYPLQYFLEQQFPSPVREALLLENAENLILVKYFKTSHEKLSHALTKLKEMKYCDEFCQKRILYYQEKLDQNYSSLVRQKGLTYVTMSYEEHFPLIGGFFDRSFKDKKP